MAVRLFTRRDALSKGITDRRLERAVERRDITRLAHSFDGFKLPQDGEYKNIPRTNPHDTLLAIAATTNDLIWEQDLEWTLPKEHTSIEELEAALTAQRYGNARIRRVLNLRPRARHRLAAFWRLMQFN